MPESDLFDNSRALENRPLADRMRPRNLDEFSGQAHIVGQGKPLRSAIQSDRIHSMVLWGPPGTGKTTLASLIASHSGAKFLKLSAVLAGVRDIRAAVDEARSIRKSEERGTLLFIDEVHRFNKGQQDALLPHVEDGTLVFVGATTENPSFELNNALLSRARTYVLRRLEPSDLSQVIERALADRERGLGDRAIRVRSCTPSRRGSVVALGLGHGDVGRGRRGRGDRAFDRHDVAVLERGRVLAAAFCAGERLLGHPGVGACARAVVLGCHVETSVRVSEALL